MVNEEPPIYIGSHVMVNEERELGFKVPEVSPGRGGVVCHGVSRCVSVCCMFAPVSLFRVFVPSLLYIGLAFTRLSTSLYDSARISRRHARAVKPSFKERARRRTKPLLSLREEPSIHRFLLSFGAHISEHSRSRMKDDQKTSPGSP